MGNPNYRANIGKWLIIAFVTFMLSIISTISLLNTKFSFSIFSYFISYKMLIILSLTVILTSIAIFIYNFLKL